MEGSELFWSRVLIILERSVYYFEHFGGEVFFLKIGCAECDFTKGVSVIYHLFYYYFQNF
jgi:hypothetical protein